MSTSFDESSEKASLDLLKLSDIDQLAEELLKEIDRELGSQSRSDSFNNDEGTTPSGVVSSAEPSQVVNNTSTNDEMNEPTPSVRHGMEEVRTSEPRANATSISSATPTSDSDQNNNRQEHRTEIEKLGQQVSTESTDQDVPSHSLVNRDGPLPNEETISFTILSSDVGSSHDLLEKQTAVENDDQHVTSEHAGSPPKDRSYHTILRVPSSDGQSKKENIAFSSVVSSEEKWRNETLVEPEESLKDIPPTTSASVESTLQDEPSYSVHDGDKPLTEEDSTSPTIPMSISVPQLSVLEELHEIVKVASPRSGGTFRSTLKDGPSCKMAISDEPQSNKHQVSCTIPRSVSIPKLDLLEELDKIARHGPPVTGAYYESAYEDRRPSNVTKHDIGSKPNLLAELDKVARLGPPVTGPYVDSAYDEEKSTPIITVKSPAHKTNVEAPPNGLSYSEYRDMRDGHRRRPVLKLQWYHYDKLDWNSLHGISGVLFLVFVSAELLQFLLTRQPSNALRLINLFLATTLYLGGVFSKKMLESPLGLLMNRLGAWNVAYVSLGMSFFTLPGDQWLSGEVHLINVIGSIIFPVALLDSLTVLRSELKSHRIFLKGFLVENAVVYSHLLGVPIVRLWLGYDRVVELYTTYRLSECIYAISLFSALVVSTVSFHACRVSAGKLQIEAHYTIISLLWGWVHLPGCAVLMWFLTSYLGGLRFYARSLFVFFIASVLEKLLEDSDRLRYKSIEMEQRRHKKKLR